MSSYIQGQTVVVKVNFFDPVGRVGVAPSYLTLRVLDPTGTEVDTILSGITNPAEGQYQANVVADLVGVWTYRWEATGSFAAAAEGSFIVNPSLFL